MTAKQRLAQAIRSLPDDASMEEAVKWLSMIYKIQRGLSERKEAAEPASDFWIEPTIEELASEQGVVIPQQVNQLIGQGTDLFSNEEEFDDFVHEIHRRRGVA